MLYWVCHQPDTIDELLPTSHPAGAGFLLPIELSLFTVMIIATVFMIVNRKIMIFFFFF